jgi:glycosyltransferase involved in cell wall biosynthesis
MTAPDQVLKADPPLGTVGHHESAGASAGGHILMTVNAAWNLVNFRSALIRALIADGYRVTALAPHDEHASKLEAMGCRFIPLRMNNKGASPFEDAALLMRFTSVLRRERPSVVLGYTIKNNIYGALAARSLSIPFIPNVTGLGTAFIHQSALNRIVRKLYAVAFRDLPVVFFQNTDDRALFVEGGLVDRRRAEVLPGSGIDLEHFAPARLRRQDTVRFLLVARLLWDKGIGEYVTAARAVRRTHPKTEFLLLGPAGVDNRTAIPLETVASWEAEGVVRYLGAVQDVRPQIGGSDCVVLPSYREGTPRTLLEAAALARPVIATDVPGCRQVVDPGRSGLLCSPRDSESLATQMRTMIEIGHEGRAAMGSAGRRKMERDYDVSRVVQAYRHQLYRLGLDEGSPNRAHSETGIAGVDTPLRRGAVQL